MQYGGKYEAAPRPTPLAGVSADAGRSLGQYLAGCAHFSLRGWWFSAALAAYFAVLALTLALILRKRELWRLSIELEMPEREIPAYLRRLRRERHQKTN